MLIRNISDLRATLRANSCLLGLDYGSKVIGIAVSDPNLRVASPLTGLARRKFAEDAAALAALIKDRNIGGLVFGLPKNMAGGESPAAQAVRAFARNLTQKSFLPDPELPVFFWDERFSTAAVERFLIAGDMSRKRREEVVDKAAAAYILQGVLDALNSPVFSKPS